MGSRRKKYDREFRLEAIHPASDPNTTAGAVERDLVLYQGAISHWKKKYTDNLAIEIFFLVILPYIVYLNMNLSIYSLIFVFVSFLLYI